MRCSASSSMGLTTTPPAPPTLHQHLPQAQGIPKPILRLKVSSNSVRGYPHSWQASASSLLFLALDKQKPRLQGQPLRATHQQCTKRCLCSTESIRRCPPQGQHRLINSLCAHGKQMATQAQQDGIQSHLVPGRGSSASSSSATLQDSMPCKARATRWPRSQLHLLLIFCPFTRFPLLPPNTPVFLFLPLKTQGLAFQNAN